MTDQYRIHHATDDFTFEANIDMSATKKRLNTVGKNALKFLAADVRNTAKRSMKKGDTRRKGQVVARKSAAAGDPPFWHDNDDQPSKSRLLQKLLVYELQENPSTEPNVPDMNNVYYVGPKIAAGTRKNTAAGERPVPNVMEHGGTVRETVSRSTNGAGRKKGSRPDVTPGTVAYEKMKERIGAQPTTTTTRTATYEEHPYMKPALEKETTDDKNAARIRRAL